MKRLIPEGLDAEPKEVSRDRVSLNFIFIQREGRMVIMESLTREERERLLKTLEEDREFRYAIAGLIGMREILERLDHVEENIEKLWMEVRGLREGQEKLWEGQEKLWKGQEKLWMEVRELRKGQKKLWEEVRELRKGQEKLWREVGRLSFGFRQLGRAVGVTLEHYAAAFLERMLVEGGYPEELKIEVDVKIKYDDKLMELDLFCRDPLLVGEVTTFIGSSDEAEREVEKLLRRSREVEKLLGRGVEYRVLAVANLTSEASKALREMSERYGILIIVGREMEEEDIPLFEAL